MLSFFPEDQKELTQDNLLSQEIILCKIHKSILLLLLLPQAYIGIKGLKIAKKPDPSKGHIIWGIILIVFTATGLISPFLAFIQGNDVFANISEFCSIAVDVFVLFEYVKFAKAVRNGI